MSRDLIFLALIIGGFTLAGAFGSQWLLARTTLKTAKMQILFQKKADAYQRLLEAIAEFTATKGPNQTRELANALDATLVVCSWEVFGILTDRVQGLRALVEMQKRADASSRPAEVAAKEVLWGEINSKIILAIRNDMQSLIG